MLSKRQIVERRDGIGGSDIAAIYGLNPYKSALSAKARSLSRTQARTFRGRFRRTWPTSGARSAARPQSGRRSGEHRDTK